MVGGLQALQSLLSGLHDMKSSLVELRDGYVSSEDIVNAAVANDEATVTSTAIDNPSVSLEPDARMDGCSAIDQLIDSIGNLEHPNMKSSLVAPKDGNLSIEYIVDIAVGNHVATVTSTAMDNPSVSQEPESRMDGCSTNGELIRSIDNSKRPATLSEPYGKKDHGSGASSAVDVADVHSIDRGMMEFRNALDDWSDYTEADILSDQALAKECDWLLAMKSSEAFEDIAQLQLHITRMEELIGRTRLPPGKIVFSYHLAEVLLLRNSRQGNFDDIDRAIQLCEEAIAAYPYISLDFPNVFSTLGRCYSERFSRFGAADDLERSIRAYEAAVAAIPENHPDQPQMLYDLSSCLGCRYSRFHDLGDRERITRLSEAAVTKTPMDQVYQTVFKFAESWDENDLDTAIQAGEEALASAVGYRGRPALLSYLGYLLSIRWFCMGGSLEDVIRAQKLSVEALAATPLDAPARGDRLTALSLQFGGVPTMQRVSEILSRLLDDMRRLEDRKLRVLSNDPNRPDRLQQLDMLSYIFQMLHDRITASAENLNGADYELFDMHKMCKKYGIYDLIIERLVEGGMDNLMIQLLDSPLLLYMASGEQGKVYKTPISRWNQSRDLLLLEAWHCQKSPPRERIRAARLAATCLASGSRWEEASALLQDAVQLLPQLTPQFLMRDDQEYMLSECTQLPSDAVSMALEAGATPSHCLGILELGRGVIMGLAINCRSDVSELQIKYPSICDRFKRLCMEIDSPLVGPDSVNITHESERRRRIEAIKEIDETLVSIRQLPDFGGFQLVPRPKDLTALAANGPIIIFNTTDLRSDAIIVTSSIKSIALPKMIHWHVLERMAELPRLVRGKLSTWRRRNARMAEILLWLWEVAVEPVLEELGPDISRVWWIGVGPLANAPFHAAGDHSRGSTCNTISRVISSYIPTIKALMYATEKKLDLNQNCSVLLVTMPTTPPVITAAKTTLDTNGIFTLDPATAKTWKPLHSAVSEANDIINAVNGIPTTRMDCPTITQVIENIPAYNVIHFACHGVSDGQNPSNSHLILCSDKTSEAGKLTVGTISNINIQNAQIAYLSACSTAHNRSTELADESIHIASGFQLAGFSHVLGTLWPSDDIACRLVAGEFYRTLFNGKVEGHRAVSTAFHHALLEL